jgi:tetratricopeptide (TPR) repeat protein
MIRWFSHAVPTFAVLALLAANPLRAADNPPQSGPQVTKPADAEAAAERADAKRYADCMALAKSKPTDGWEAALTWIGEGGGDPARHCGAVALIGLKQYREAAQRLEDIARTSFADPSVRAGMLDQAGQAWILDNDPNRAYADQTTALQLVPDSPDLLIDRAESLALSQAWPDALADLNHALSLAPDRADALTYRATAKRMLNDLPGAAKDVDRALALDKGLPEAWLEAGNVRRLSGDSAGAHKAWQQVLDLAPTSPAADAARLNLEKLDVKQ